MGHLAACIVVYIAATLYIVTRINIITHFQETYVPVGLEISTCPSVFILISIHHLQEAKFIFYCGCTRNDQIHTASCKICHVIHHFIGNMNNYLTIQYFWGTTTKKPFRESPSSYFLGKWMTLITANMSDSVWWKFVQRPSPPPGFDCSQYAKTGGEKVKTLRRHPAEQSIHAWWLG